MNPRNWSRRTKIIVGVFAVIVIVAAATSSTKKSPPRSGATTAANNAADAQAQTSVALALKEIASDRQVFHAYVIVSSITLKNVVRALRSVPSLRASGTKNTFTVSVQSASGTTFELDGTGVDLARVCRPVGADCPGGHWSGSAKLALAPVPMLSPAQKAQVRSILLANVDHYAGQGQQILGSTAVPERQRRAQRVCRSHFRCKPGRHAHARPRTGRRSGRRRYA